jgi:AmmeMemoRadiSam system protein A
MEHSGGRAHEDSADTERRALLEIALRSIRNGLDGGQPLVPEPDALGGWLGRSQGAFVTLHRQDELRGCVGSMEGEEGLGATVARVAWEAAFGDSRFLPLRSDELDSLRIEISVLSPLEEVAAGSLEELGALLRPRVDGLLIETRGHHATFLPAVWENVSGRDEFLTLLWLKAGLSPGWWPVTAYRYTAEEFEATVPELTGGSGLEAPS